MTTSTVCTVEQVGALMKLVGVEQPPQVLQVPPTARRLTERGVGDLRAGGLLLADGEPADSLIAAVRILGAPTVHLDARTIPARPAGASGSRADRAAVAHLLPRVCLARLGTQHARAVRRGPTVTVEQPGCDGSGRRLAALITMGGIGASGNGARGSGPGGIGTDITFPAAVGSAELSACKAVDDFIATLRFLGGSKAAAAAFGRALAAAQTATEIVLSSRGRQVPGAVVVFRGAPGAPREVIASTAPGHDGLLWTTVSFGGVYRVGQALGRVCESLPGGSWLG